MTQTVAAGIGELRARMTGRVILPADPDYDDARRVWNAAIDRRPAVIARCASAGDVAAAVAFATRHDLEIAVRGGAHSISGASVVDDGLMIDLSSLNQVTVDVAEKTARVGGGALLSALDAATAEHGLAVPAGMVSHTGVGGLTLGGGMGWLSRKAGLSIDNLLSAEVVTANASAVRCSPYEHAELFWAIRGGGGNFGVVTEFEFQLHEVDPMVEYGFTFWDLSQGAEVLRLADKLVAELPPDLNVIVGALNAPPAPFVPAEHQFKPGYAIILVGFGTSSGHADVMSRIASDLPPLVQFATPMPYVALQQLLDEANGWGTYAYDKGAYLESFSEDAISVITKQIPQKSSPMSVMLCYRLDGAYCAVPEDATAFSGGRSPRWGVFIIGICPSPEGLEAERGWVRDFWQTLLPQAMGAGAYINAFTDATASGIQASYGFSKYARLAYIKSQYDPQNVFHRNANILPA